MRVVVRSAAQIKKGCLVIMCAAAAVLLLCYPQAVQTGVRRGLAICTDVLVPSLFLFLVLSGFVIRAGIADVIGRRLRAPMRWLFGFSGNASVAMLVSLIGGYPAGANAVAQFCEQGELDADEARRLLRCCVSAGPAFVVGGVGVGMLGSAKAGVLLLVAHWLAFLIVALTERGQAPRGNACPVASMPVGTALTQSVHAAASALLSMCGFVLLSTGVISLLDAMGLTTLSPVWRCLIACLTEVSAGCTEAASMRTATPFWLGAALGFGGLSVHGQIAARTADHRLFDRGFLRARLLHALLGGCLSMLLFWRWHPVGVSASVSLSAFTPSGNGASGLVAMMLLCVLFVYTLPYGSEKC